MEILMILNAIDFQLTDRGLQSKLDKSSSRQNVLERAQPTTLGQVSILNLRKSRADRKMRNMLTGFCNVENIRVDCILYAHRIRK
jgi:hypothetical protein